MRIFENPSDVTRAAFAGHRAVHDADPGDDHTRHEGLTMSDFDDDVGNVPLLQGRIVALSTAKNFATARFEWKLHEIELADTYGTHRCLCEHRIKELCEEHPERQRGLARQRLCQSVHWHSVRTRVRRAEADRGGSHRRTERSLGRVRPRLRDRERLGISLPGNIARNRKPTDKQLITRTGLSRRIVDRSTRPHTT